MAKLQLGVNDLATVRPDLAAQLVDPSLAETVTEFSHKRLLWFCETGHPRHEWEAMVFSRTKGGRCGACSGKVVIPGWNDLGTVRPDLAAQLVYPSQAEEVTEFSQKRLLWFCETGHPRYEWPARVADRSNGRDCGVCSGQTVLIGWNDLGTVSPDLATQLVDPSDAKTVTVSSGKKLLWFCQTNHPRYEWPASADNRSKGRGCKVCSGKTVLVGWNDLGTVNPDLAKQLVDPTIAKTVTAFSHKRLLWFCEKEHPRHEWKSTASNRSSGRGCKVCAESGYDPSKPGDLYRFEFSDRGVTFLCYGITNVVDQRLKTYERQLEIKNFQSLHFEDGAIPQKLEKSFNEIRKQSPAPASTCGVVGTITESFPISDVELSTAFTALWVANAR